MRRCYLAGVAMILGALLPSTSSASDESTWPGLMCQWVSGGSFQRMGSTVFNNSSVSFMRVTCPLGRTSQGSLIGATTRVFDRNPTVDVGVTLNFEVGSGSQLLVVSDTRFTTQSSANVKLLNHGSLNIANTHGTYYATCDVPPSSNGQVSHISGFLLAEVGTDTTE
jgi:hypothetical protein